MTDDDSDFGEADCCGSQGDPRDPKTFWCCLPPGHSGSHMTPGLVSMGMTIADSPGLSSTTGTLDLLTLRHNLNMVLWGHKGTVIDNDSTPALSKALEECVIRTMESYRR